MPYAVSYTYTTLSQCISNYFGIYQHTFVENRLDEDSLTLLEWELAVLNLQLVQSMFFESGVGLATGPTKSIKKGDLICRFLGRHVVATSTELDEIFHPKFHGNHDRLILLGPEMQPIVQHTVC